MGAHFSDDVDLDGHKITGLGTPTADGDAATKAYVDTAAGSPTQLEQVDGDWVARVEVSAFDGGAYAEMRADNTGDSDNGVVVIVNTSGYVSYDANTYHRWAIGPQEVARLTGTEFNLTAYPYLALRVPYGDTTDRANVAEVSGAMWLNNETNELQLYYGGEWSVIANKASSLAGDGGVVDVSGLNYGIEATSDTSNRTIRLYSPGDNMNAGTVYLQAGDADTGDFFASFEVGTGAGHGIMSFSANSDSEYRYMYFSATGGFGIDSGSTANRPSAADVGTIYFDTDEGALIVHDGSGWTVLGGGGGGGVPETSTPERIYGTDGTGDQTTYPIASYGGDFDSLVGSFFGIIGTSSGDISTVMNGEKFTVSDVVSPAPSAELGPSSLVISADGGSVRTEMNVNYFIPSSFPTVSRPAFGQPAGAIIFDTDLGIPIFWDGSSSWKDFAGNVV